MLERNNFAHLSHIKSESGEMFILKYQIYEIKYSNILISSILNIIYIYIYKSLSNSVRRRHIHVWGFAKNFEKKI